MDEGSHHLDPWFGTVRRCSKPEACIWGKPHEHSTDPRTVRRGYEMMMEDYLFSIFRKTDRTEYPTPEEATSAYFSQKEKGIPVHRDSRNQKVLWVHEKVFIAPVSR
jgi:hypothetical protein